VVHTQHVVRRALDVRRDRMAVQRAKEQGAKHEHVQRALQQFHTVGRRLLNDCQCPLLPSDSSDSVVAASSPKHPENEIPRSSAQLERAPIFAGMSRPQPDRGIGTTPGCYGSR
jgi:hypothetical protein